MIAEVRKDTAAARRVDKGSADDGTEKEVNKMDETAEVKETAEVEETTEPTLEPEEDNGPLSLPPTGRTFRTW
jgi:hypothetical protein